LVLRLQALWRRATVAIFVVPQRVFGRGATVRVVPWETGSEEGIKSDLPSAETTSGACHTAAVLTGSAKL
jgi:hypothetical protein